MEKSSLQGKHNQQGDMETAADSKKEQLINDVCNFGA